MIIALDGPAASGKGTLARRLARHYGLPYLDTGLIYRATAALVLDRGGRIDDEGAAERAAHELDLAALRDDERLRSRAMGEAASVVAAMPSVRAALLTQQRAFATQPQGAVLDGRDIGTVVCPEAQAKIFVTASPDVRAHRRHMELLSRGEASDFAAILDDIRKRDARDSARATAPLIAAPDAHMLDTSALGIEDAFTAALALVERARTAPPRI
jgi:CMP/dCMP kinase